MQADGPENNSIPKVDSVYRSDVFGDPVPRWKQVVFSSLGLILVLVSASQILVSSIYAGKAYPGVTVAGQEIGGISRHQAKEILQSKIDGYKVALKVESKSYVATPEDMGISYDLNSTLDDAFIQGKNQWLAAVGLFETLRSRGINYSYKVDNDKKKAYIDKIVADTGKAPVDATVVVENGEPKVQPDVNGVGLSTTQVESAIFERVSTVDADPVVLTQSSQPARIKSKDVEPAIKETKVLLSTPVTITYLGKVFQPTSTDMSNWYVFEKTPPDEPAGVKPKVSTDGIKNYLQKVAVQINVSPVNKKVRIENGVASVEREGAEGLALDQDSLSNQIASSVSEKKSFTGEAPTVKLGFKTETNRVTTLAYGKYIEINLARQYMWVYQDQKVIFESPITSGAAGAGFPTVQGLFSVMAKQTNRNLNGYAIGYNYNVFVNYWMPFFGNYGLHDASWRSSFGGSDYYYGGSHGCVNMPLNAAAFLYGWADVGTPVWVHS